MSKTGEAGNRRELISVFVKTTTEDAIGGHGVDWVEFGRRFASVHNVGQASEGEARGGGATAQRMRFTVPYERALEGHVLAGTVRIEYRSLSYDVQNGVDPHSRGKDLEIFGVLRPSEPVG